VIISTLGSEAGNYAAIAAGTAASAIPVCGPVCGAAAVIVVKLIDAAAGCPGEVKVTDPCNPPSIKWPCKYDEASKKTLKNLCVILTELRKYGYSQLQAWAKPCAQMEGEAARRCVRAGAQYRINKARRQQSLTTNRSVPLYKNPVVLGVGAAAILGAVLLFR
jgi:hypothetical protein